MTEEEADALSTELNLELGEQGIDDRFFVAVRTAAGEWKVEEQREKTGWISRFVAAMPNLPGW